MSAARGKGSKAATSARSSSLDVAGVDELLDEVPPSFHTARDFNPFVHYDDSVDELTGYSEAVREAIELVVEAHYKGFNQATAAFTHVVQHFKTAQSNVQQLLASLAASKALLTAKNDRLREQWQHTQTLTHINQSLAKLTYLVTLPGHMTVLESSRQYLHCVILISHTLSVLSEEDMREVEGLLELREDIINRRNNIVDALLHHTQQLLFHKHARDGTGHSSQSAASLSVELDREDSHHTASSSTNGSNGSHHRSATSSPVDALQQPAANGRSSPSSLTVPSSAGSVSSSASTMAFLTSNVLSPFHPSNAPSLDFALPVSSSVLNDPAWRSVSHLLHDERSAAFVAAPFAHPQLALFLVVAALDHIHALPSAKLQLSRTVRQEVAAILTDIKQHIKQHSGSKRRKRIVAEGAQAAAEFSPSLKPLASPSNPPVAPLSPSAGAFTSSAAASSSSSRSAISHTTQSTHPSEPSTTLPRVSTSDRSTLSDMLSRVFTALMSALRMYSQLIHVTAMVQAARRDMQTVTDAAQQQQQSQQQSADKRKAPAKKDSGNVDREDSRWSVLHVWATMQVELEALLQELLLNSAGGQLKLGSGSSGAGSAVPTVDGKAGKGSKADELDLTFSFDDASAPSIARMSRGKDDNSLSAHLTERRQHQAALRREQRAVVPPSPYNITVLYRPIVHFCRQVQQLCLASVGREQEVSDASAHLLTFLLRFVHSSFLPRLQADVNIRVDAILADEHAFDECESPSHDAGQQSTAAALLAFFNFAYASQPTASFSSRYASRSSPAARLQCVVAVCDLVLVLLSDATTLPSFAVEYVSVVDSVLNRLQTACHDRYTDACRGVYSTTRLMDSALMAAMEHEQPYSSIIMQRPRHDTAADPSAHFSAASPSSSPTLSFSASNPLYAAFFSFDFSLRPDQLMSDPRNVAQLCLLHSSLEWLCDQLYGTLRGTDNVAASTPLSTLADGNTSKPHPVTSFRLDEQQVRQEASQPIDDNGRTQDGGSSVSVYRRVLSSCSGLLSLSTRCLLNLRLECQCCLLGALCHIRSSTYSLAAVPTEPEAWVLQANVRLSVLDSCLQRLCSARVRRYVLHSTFSLVALFARRCIGQLSDRRITWQGVAQLHKDLFALQQQLTNMQHYGAEPANDEEAEAAAEAEQFDSTLFYLDLLLASDDELHREEHMQLFAENELAALHALVANNNIHATRQREKEAASRAH